MKYNYDPFDLLIDKDGNLRSSRYYELACFLSDPVGYIRRFIYRWTHPSFRKELRTLREQVQKDMESFLEEYPDSNEE